MPVEFRHPQKRTFLSLVDGDQLAQAFLELREIFSDQIVELVEVAVGEEVDTLRAVVVGQPGVDVRTGGTQREFDFLARPGQRLDAPLFPACPVMLQRLVVALRHEDPVQRDSQSLQPVVGIRQDLGGDVALRDFQYAVHHVRVDDGLAEDLIPARGRHRVEVPELPGE